MKTSTEQLFETVPAPGWYQNVPSHVYHSWKLASSTGLKHFEKAPALYQSFLAEDGGQTEAQIVGEAFHYAVLQPELFATHYAVAPDVDGRTKEGKARLAEFRAEFPHAMLLKRAQYDMVCGMANAIENHPFASLLVDTASEIEVSGVWEDACGPKCKQRIDLATDEFGAMVDLKSTEDASPRSFLRDIFKYRYDRQGAFYRRGARELDKHYEEFVIVAVEKSAPHLVACYRITPELLKAAELELEQMLFALDKCEQSGVWPGYSAELIDVTPPEWLVNKVQRIEL